MISASSPRRTLFHIVLLSLLTAGYADALNLGGNPLSLGGSTVMQVNASTGAASTVLGISTATYGGTLSVANLSGTLAAGNSFALFTAGTYTGAFTGITLPTLPDNLMWDTSQLATNGSIGVILSPWGTWRSQQFSSLQQTNSAISGPTAAPAGDGIPNLMKYALNLPAGVSGVGGLPVESGVRIGGSNYLTLSYTQALSATDITYTVQVSGDLKTWNSGSTYTSVISTTDNTGGQTATVVVQDRTPISAGARRFMRLVVTQP